MARSKSRRRKKKSEEDDKKSGRQVQVKNNERYDYTARTGDGTRVTFPAGEWSDPIDEEVWLELQEDERVKHRVEETGTFAMKAAS